MTKPSRERVYSLEEAQTQIDAGVEAAVEAAVAADKARMRGILTHEAAKGREKLARHFAYETDMSVEAAVKIMEMAGRDEAPVALVGEGAFAEAMRSGLESDRAAQVGAGEATVARVLRTVRQVMEPGALVADEECVA